MQDLGDGQEVADGVDLIKEMGMASKGYEGRMRCKMPEEYQVSVAHRGL